MKKTLLVMAGGTGGHVFPGLAVARIMKDKGWNVVWMGNPESMEAKLVPAHGYTMSYVRFGALRGKGLLRKLKLPFALLSGFLQAGREIRRIRPDVVLGMGGYISFPGGFMAALMGYPLVIHEQNSVAGLANRVLAWVAKKVACGFPGALPDSEWTGNPVREEITKIAPPAERFVASLASPDSEHRPINLLVLGGSLGAAAINEMVPKGLALIDEKMRPQVIHQAGEKHLSVLQANYAAAGVKAECVAFVDDMSKAYAWADLVLCRSGALTVSELAACGVASILVPFPLAVDDHQTGNAWFLASTGAAIILKQAEMTPESIALMKNYTRSQLYQMAERARALAKPEAAAELAKICEQLAK